MNDDDKPDWGETGYQREDMPVGYGYFDSMDHALVAGFVWGVAMRTGLDLTPEIDGEGNYTGIWELRDPDYPKGTVTVIRLRVLPPRPEDRQQEQKGIES